MTHSLAHTYEIEEREMIVKTDDVRVHTMQLERGQTVPWHKHSQVDDTFVCLSGRTIVRTDDGHCEAVLSPGELHSVPAGVGHFVMPGHDAGTKFLLIQAIGQHDFLPISEPII